MLKSHFDVEDNHLVMGDVSVVDLAERFGTPLYVMDEQQIRRNYRRFYRAYSDLWENVSVFYAYKANSNTAVCKVLSDEGCGAEVSSLCELRVALDVGVPGEKIVFNGNNKTVQELELAIGNDVLINVDNLQELQIIGKLASRLRKKARIGFRVNPNVEAPTHPYIATGLRESKFGLDVANGKALEAYQKASKMDEVKVKSVHSHIGSQILDPDPFVEQAEKLILLMGRVKEKIGIELEIVNMGGGLGIPYRPDEKALPPEELAGEVVGTVCKIIESEDLTEPILAFEPGRSIVGDAGLLLGRIGYVKKRAETPDWVSMNVGMNALIRPALYYAYHHIEVANKMGEERKKTVNIAGPLCESGDYLGKERRLPKVERGDLLAVFDVGAYGLSMSSQHTAQPRPAVVMVNSGKAEVIRRREQFEDLTGLDAIPKWLG